jgi:hypothetical protein
MAGGADIVQVGWFVERGIIWTLWKQEKTCDFRAEVEKKVGRPLTCVAVSNGKIGERYC